MEFGRVEDLSNVDVTLPPDHAATAAVLAAGKAARAAAKPRVYVGGPIWNDATMARKLAPPGVSLSDKLAVYAACFNSVELNASGYGLSAASAAGWAKSVDEGFLFCPKIPRDISHGRNLEVTGEAYDRFVAAAGAFGDHLGMAFLQFSESFGPSRFAELSSFLRAQARKIPLALELRHVAWFNDASRSGPLFDLLSEHGVAAVLTDVPDRRDLLHMRLTTPTAFIRFSGHDLGPKDLRRVDDWVARLKTWLDRGLRTLYFFPHHEPKHFSVDWCVRFLEAAAAAGLDVPAAPKLREPAPAKSPSKRKSPG